MSCRMCHADLQDRWLFCPYCGIKIGTGKSEEDIRKTLTFGELYERWIQSYRFHISASTVYCYQAARKYYSALEDVPFCTLDLEDLQSCVDRCPRGKRTRENMKALACLMFRYALPRHISDQNYALFLDTGRGNRTPRTSFSPGEIRTIMEHVGKTPWADEIAVLIYTGFRPCELMELKKDRYVETPEVSYLIGGRKTAAGKDRIVTLSPKIAPLVRSRAAGPGEYLFPDSQGRKMSVKFFREKHFYPALADMGLQPLPQKGEKPRFTPYTCRHTFSDLIKRVSGADRDKAALMGHADYQTTRTMYQSSVLADRKEITDQL